MESDKPRILLVWGYHRKGWVDAFNQLKDAFRFELLHYLEKPDNEENHTDFPTHYWLDFSSAKAIIDRVKPDKVIFMSTEGIPSTALNAACKRQGIPTIVFQHGMFQPYENYLMDVQLQTQQALAAGKKSHNKPNDRSTNLRLLKFYLRSFSIGTLPGAFLYLFRLRLLRRKNYEIEALRLLPSALRVADEYVVFTRYNTSFFTVRDGVKPDQYVEIGNPEFDAYTEEKVKSEDYFLYIHSPLTYLPEWDSQGFMTQEEENTCLEKMNAFALQQGCRLVIKLHPYSWHNEEFVQHPNIEYVKEGDNVRLILEARGVFGFNSTLILPAAYYKTVCLFTLGEFSHIQEDLEAIGAVKLVPFHACTPADLEGAMVAQQQPNKSALLDRYLFKMDGRALERLKAHLLN
ncbi:MAG: polysialyltransferase family glycosyltransferase [Bacteroidota bacterium]